MDPTGGGFYDDAQVYEVLHAQDTARDIRLLSRLARRFGHTRPRAHPTWLEPACGPARHLRLAARRGIHVIGIDLAPAMIAAARARFDADRHRRPRGIRGRFLIADMARPDLVLPPASVDLAFCLINSIRHLETSRDLAAHLRGIAAVLRPGGLYVVGLSLTVFGLESPSEDVWEGRQGALHVKQVVNYLPAPGERDPFERVISHLVITRGRGPSARVEHRDQTYRLRSITRRAWEAHLADAGLHTAALVDQDGLPIKPRDLGYAVYVLSAGHGTSTRARRYTQA